MNQHVEKVLDIAGGEVGVREIGSSNTGRRVEEYQASTTLGGTGWPWCSAYVTWCIRQGLGTELMRKCWIPTASCDVVLDWARRQEIISSKPSVGCAGLVMASRNDATHIFLVERLAGHNGGTTTLEGNTNAGGSRNGNGVYRRFRPINSRYLYVHWHQLLPTSTASELPRYSLYFGADKAADLHFIEGRNWLEAKKWAAWMNMKLAWNPETQGVMLNGKDVPGQAKFLKEDDPLLPVRSLVATIPILKLAVDENQKRVVVTK